LIDTYRKYEHQLKSPLLQRKEVWHQIASKMNEHSKNKFTGDMCNKKWSNMEATYKKKKDEKSKTGRGGGRDWAYYSQMEELIGARASVRAVSSLSSTKSSATFPCASSQPHSSSSSQLTQMSSSSVHPSSSYQLTETSSSVRPSSSSQLIQMSSTSSKHPSSSALPSSIQPSSDNSDDELRDREAMTSLSGHSGVKRKKTGQGKVGVPQWVEHLSSDMKTWQSAMDKRLENMETLERERIGVLREVKDLMKVWVENMVRRPNVDEE
jgi:hypothetical protein